MEQRFRIVLDVTMSSLSVVWCICSVLVSRLDLWLASGHWLIFFRCRVFVSDGCNGEGIGSDLNYFCGRRKLIWWVRWICNTSLLQFRSPRDHEAFYAAFVFLSGPSFSAEGIMQQIRLCCGMWKLIWYMVWWTNWVGIDGYVVKCCR